MPGVIWWVHRRQLVAEGQAVAVFGNQRVGVVVRADWYREPGNGPVTDTQEEKWSLSC